MIRPAAVKHVVVTNGLAYLLNAERGLQVADIRSTTSPALVGGAPAALRGLRFQVVGDNVYVPDGEARLGIFEVRALMPQAISPNLPL